MSLIAFILIVASAIMHASWNMIAKRSAMSIAFYGAICFVAASLWIHTQIWTPINVSGLPWKFYLFLVCSLLSDFIYCLGLVRAYRTMEMSTAYPMMRSLPLLFTAALTSAAGLGKPLTPVAMLGMVIVFAGCLMMPLVKFSDFRLKDYLNSKMFFIIVVACGTTGYTIFDSQALSALGACYPDISKPVVSMTYYSTRSMCLGPGIILISLLIPAERKILLKFFRERDTRPLMAGLFASLTYVTVLVAMNYVSNVSYVQAFRQLGLLFGLAGGILILKERCAAPKIAGVFCILSGLFIAIL